MKALILWLYRRRLANIILLISYFLLVVLPHEEVGLLTVQIFGHLSRDTYNLIILIAGLIGLLFYFVPVIRNIWKGTDKRLKLFYLLLTIALVALVFNTLFVINIEVVHFVQYAVMAILLFPLTLRYWDTLYWATLLGAIDEAYQYFYLAPLRTDYYDFNDVITNLLGAALGLVYLRTFDLGILGKDGRKWYEIVPLWSTVVLFSITVILIQQNLLSVYPPSEGEASIFTLVKKMPAGFWSVVHPNVTYHVVLPGEGVIWTMILLMMFLSLSRNNNRTLENKYE